MVVSRVYNMEDEIGKHSNDTIYCLCFCKECYGFAIHISKNRRCLCPRCTDFVLNEDKKALEKIIDDLHTERYKDIFIPKIKGW